VNCGDGLNIAILIVLPVFGLTATHVNAEPPQALDLLSCSISYHDPQGNWQKGAFRIVDVSTQPDGTVGRRTIVQIDNAHGHVDIETHLGEHVISATVRGDAVDRLLLDGRSAFTQDEIRRFQLSSEQVLSKRNFFLYLLGLPMKLRDPGTRIEPIVKSTIFQGMQAYQLRVTYDSAVGTDTWYFYLDPNTCALLGHRFHHDDAARDGEYAVLSDEIRGMGLRLPRVRKWYGNQDGKWFITHTIESIESIDSTSR
jgi:hypothetical protein